MVLKKNKKEEILDTQPPESEGISTQAPEEGPLSTNDTTDLDLSVAAKAAAAPELSSDDMVKLNDEMDLCRVEAVETESDKAEFGEVVLPEEEFLKVEGTDLNETLADGTVLIATKSVAVNGHISDLHFVDRGTGESLATENIDPFDVLLRSSAPPPWPFDGEEIPEI
ncbi:MAG: hypothetical protein KJ804_05215 [Proteobacteria bacterium]|nr:hypothetical protein [Pseudomonadota bacterium]MBU1057703.1 hypothetical protein [Pseudomonadota bacterium]